MLNYLGERLIAPILAKLSLMRQSALLIVTGKNADHKRVKLEHNFPSYIVRDWQRLANSLQE
ncbi:hypothetical protein AO381_0932 [Moraxella catarrhalis]|nr:hypothetical protein AO381_0932 [Moraxella catarrhalis]